MNRRDGETRTRRCAVLGDRTVAERWAARGRPDADGGFVRFDPMDDDKLNDAVCAGGFDLVVFADPEAFLTALWRGHVRPERWDELGVRIEFARGVDGDTATVQAILKTTCESYRKWREAQRRRQIVAGTILTVLSLIAVSILLGLIP